MCWLACAILLSSAPVTAAPPRISLELYRADIHNVLRLLAEVGHVNLVIDDNVKGVVTLRLRNVAWTQVLATVLASEALGQETVGEIIRIAPLKQLADEAALRASAEQKREQAAPLTTRIVPVNYARAADLVPHVRAMLSERGTVTYDQRTNVLIVRDVGSSGP
jgi:type II secretory pathway component HofQ